MATLLHSEGISRHGTETGINPRFVIQMISLWKKTFGERDSEYEKSIFPFYLKYFLPALEILYDTYHAIIDSNEKYISGLQSGLYFKKDIRGSINLDRSPERDINKKVKDFFIHGKIFLDRWRESKVVYDEYIDMEKLIKTGDANFENIVNEFLSKDSTKRYVPIFNLVREARLKLLNGFKGQRDDVEHDPFMLDKYSLQETQNGIIVHQPVIDGKPLMETLEFYYEGLLDFIEKCMAYFYGINCLAQRHLYKLYVRKDYSYPELLFKYNMHVGDVSHGYEASPSLYD